MRTPYSNFPGTITQYKNLHKWISDEFGRPSLCEDCGTTEAKRYDWAAIDNRYTKLREDWRRLCRSCHQKFDVDAFVGKRFSGMTHTAASKAKTSATMKEYWAKHPEQYAEINRKRRETFLRKKAQNG